MSYLTYCDLAVNMLCELFNVMVFDSTGKVKVDIVPLCNTPPQKCSDMAHVLKGSHSFYLLSHMFIRNRNEPYLPLPSQLYS